MAKRIQSSNLPLFLSFDGGATYKELVCVTNYTGDLTVGSTDTDTLTCGTLTGVGSVKFDFTGEGVCDIEPTTDQVSLLDLETQLLLKEPIIARVTYPGSGSMGAGYFRKGSVYVTKASLKASPNDYIKFDFELKGDGTPDIVAP